MVKLKWSVCYNCPISTVTLFSKFITDHVRKRFHYDNLFMHLLLVLISVTQMAYCIYLI